MSAHKLVIYTYPTITASIGGVYLIEDSKYYWCQFCWLVKP
ncbi:hypothetical protein [Nostoc sp. C057]|nr:hypothetical protein [Nostoc sp. C057]